MKFATHIRSVKMIQNVEYPWQRICFGRSRSCLYRSNSFFSFI